MSKTIFEASVLLVGAAFTIAFGVIVVPALIESGDIAGAFAAGFVNPFATLSADGHLTTLTLYWYALSRTIANFTFMCLDLLLVAVFALITTPFLCYAVRLDLAACTQGRSRAR